MYTNKLRPGIVGLAVIVLGGSSFAAQKTGVEGSFVLNGAEAKLAFVRAQRTKLDEKGKPGFTVLLSEREAAGDLAGWKTADPAEKGSFIFITFEENGEVWVAEIGHGDRADGRFGVVTELRKAEFAVDGDRISAHVTTAGEQEFGDDHYSVDLTFTVTIETPAKG